MKTLYTSLKTFALLTLLTGMIYPLLITAIAQWIFPKQANGSIVTWEDKIIGSELIAQKFDRDTLFWPRPSAIDYNPLPSGGSNLGPTSHVLKELIATRRKQIMETYHLDSAATIPNELLFASGSGLDPHISIAAAHFQIPRIIKARGWKEPSAVSTLVQLIHTTAEKRQWGILGAPRVNVLKLNIALESLKTPH